MSTTNHTSDEQKFWDDVFLRAYPECMKGRKRAPQGCAQDAAEQANVALNERRKAQSQEGGAL